MNGILERMAKRAWGASRAVEPLGAQRFAAGERGSPDRPFDLDTHSEIDASPSEMDPTPILVRQAESKPDPSPFPTIYVTPVRVRQAESDLEPSGLRTGPTPRWIQESEDNERRPNLYDRREREEAPELRTHETVKAPRRADTREAQDRIQPLTPIAGARVADLKTLAETNAATAPLVNGEPTRQQEQTGADLRGATDSSMPRASDTTRLRLAADERDALAQLPAEMGKRGLPPMEREGYPRPEDRAVPVVAKRIEPAAEASVGHLSGLVAAAASLEQKTEIHISIGRVELRAAREDTKPSAIPFRPRLTLDDFLRRKPEGAA
jgi:hypothetical protein